jgi:hypothetical protein
VQTKLGEAVILLQDYQHEDGPKGEAGPKDEKQSPVLNGIKTTANGDNQNRMSLEESTTGKEVARVAAVVRASEDNGDESTAAITNDDDTATDVESTFGDFSKASAQDFEGLKSFDDTATMTSST